MPLKAGYLLLTGGGAVFIWSGIKGKSVSGVFRSLIGGDKPQNAPDANPVSGITGDANTQGAGGSNVSLNVDTPANSSETAWITAFLKTIDAPATQANINSMSSWIKHETPWPPVASNNPMNTTYNLPGATNYNSVGVKNYTSQAQGIQALAATIESGLYGDILMALRSGKGLCGQSFAGLSKWSGNGYSSVC